MQRVKPGLPLYQGSPGLWLMADEVCLFLLQCIPYKMFKNHQTPSN